MNSPRILNTHVTHHPPRTSLSLVACSALVKDNRCMPGNPDTTTCVNFTGGSTFPRRLSLGGVTVSPATPGSLAGASAFSAEMHIATAEVIANLTSSTQSLSIRVVLDPHDNVAITTITAVPPLPVTIVTWVYPLAELESDQPCSGSDDPSKPSCLDGTVRSGVGLGGTAGWALRQPLGKSSSKPISVAIVTSIVDAAGIMLPAKPKPGNNVGWTCAAAAGGATSDASASCSGVAGPSGLKVATVVRSNLDVCRDHHHHHHSQAGMKSATDAGSTSTGSTDQHAFDARITSVIKRALVPCTADPVADAIDRVGKLRALGAAAAISAANARFWARFWGDTWIEMPGKSDAAELTQRYYYAHMYLIASASRGDSVPPGIWGPWVHSDSPGWAGDYTLGKDLDSLPGR